MLGYSPGALVFSFGVLVQCIVGRWLPSLIVRDLFVVCECCCSGLIRVFPIVLIIVPLSSSVLIAARGLPTTVFTLAFAVLTEPLRFATCHSWPSRRPILSNFYRFVLVHHVLEIIAITHPALVAASHIIVIIVVHIVVVTLSRSR